MVAASLWLWEGLQQLLRVVSALFQNLNYLLKHTATKKGFWRGNDLLEFCLEKPFHNLLSCDPAPVGSLHSPLVHMSKTGSLLSSFSSSSPLISHCSFGFKHFHKTKLLRVKKEKVKNAEVIPRESRALGEASHASCWLCYGADLTACWFTCPVLDTTQSWGKFQRQSSFDFPIKTTSPPPPPHRLPVLYHPPTGATVKASLSLRSVLPSLWSCWTVLTSLINSPDLLSPRPCLLFTHKRAN